MGQIRRSVKKLVKWSMRFPADVLIEISKALPDKIQAVLIHHPEIAAKFYPYQATQASYLIPHVTTDAVELGDPGLPIPPAKF